ncbi:MAG: hypothetical protein FJX72_21715, partial [Armatimonadetes bacterium]|nr:hypothetical protein [Armatimonadota bacterium]
MRRLLGRCVTPGRAMGLARTVHSRAEFIALQAGPSDQPFWAHQPSACDEPDVVLVLVSGADLSAPTDVP